MSPMNLAGVLPWTYWRGLVVVGLLAVGNAFCFACPFMLPRELGKRWFAAQRAWPSWLRGKWLAVGLLLAYLWAYEAFALWDRPAATALIVVAYFGAAFAVDAVFRGASFCEHVCPIGQFHFVHAGVAPFELRARHTDVCGSCTTHDCLRGGGGGRGCELDLFVPTKRDSLDCTLCFDCVRACPHDNVGLLAAPPGRALPGQRRPRPFARLDVAALALVCVFGAFANAAGMLEPVLSATEVLTARLGLGSPLIVTSVGLVTALVAAPAAIAFGAAWISRAGTGRSGSRAAPTETGPGGQWADATEIGSGGRRIAPTRTGASGRRGTAAGAAASMVPMRAVICRFSVALVPLGLGMWSAHFLFHFLAGLDTLPPVVQRVALDLGSPLLGRPAWPGTMAPRADWLTALALLLLDLGLLVTAAVGWRAALALGGAPRRALALAAPWALLGLALWAAGVWIVFQPMQMRGMVH